LRDRLHFSDPLSLVAGKPIRQLRIDADGTPWLNDGRVLAALDCTGSVERCLGRTTSCEILGVVAGATVAPSGWVYVQDARSGCVHAYDSDGTWRYHGPAPRNERWKVWPFPQIIVSDDGRVLVEQDSSPRKWIGFGADGVALPSVPRDRGPLAFAAGSDQLWKYADGNLQRTTFHGAPLQEISRRSDRRFFSAVEDLAVASDGRLAVLDGTEIALFDTEGRPLDVLALPDSSKLWRLAIGGRWLAVGGSSSPKYLVETDSRSLHELQKDLLLGAGSPHGFGITPEGSELWIVAGDPARLWRFALP
jgi:hypothetical protein